MDLLQANSQRWTNVKINPNKQAVFNSVAARLTSPAAVARYKSVEARTGVPWWFIAVVHEREASQSWSANLAQGDRWDRRSIHVPAGRGPFESWEDAAYDALVNCGPYAARNHDWSPGSALTWLEKYNGLGYANRGRPSPYIWAGTNQYTSGKYVSDGVYDASAVDTQLGCAGLLIAMKAFEQPSTPAVKTPPKATQMATGAVIAAAGSGVATQAPTHLWPYIVAGSVVLGLAVWAILHFTNKGN